MIQRALCEHKYKIRNVRNLRKWRKNLITLNLTGFVHLMTFNSLPQEQICPETSVLPEPMHRAILSDMKYRDVVITTRAAPDSPAYTFRPPPEGLHKSMTFQHGIPHHWKPPGGMYFYNTSKTIIC